VAVPAATPVKIPLLAPIVAIAVLLLLHVPPPASLKVEVVGLDPPHTNVVPVIAAGFELTVNTAVDVAHPLPRLYVIVVLPAVEPGLTTPEVAPTVATPVVLLVQVPPVGDELNVDVAPLWHPVKVPEIDDGTGRTVTVFVAETPPQGLLIE